MCSIDEEWMNFLSSQQPMYGSNISMSVHQNSFLNSRLNESKNTNLKMSEKNNKNINTPDKMDGLVSVKPLKNTRNRTGNMSENSKIKLCNTTAETEKQKKRRQTLQGRGDDYNETDKNSIWEDNEEVESECNEENEEINPISNVDSQNENEIDSEIGKENENDSMPLCDELYISTKTKVVFLNSEINIQDVFWNIPIIEYWRPCEGVIKKQMKVVSKNAEEFKEYQEHIKNIPYYTENIIKQIDNRGKFKDERKITVGISKKDIMNYRGKVKNAFYNCFAMIIRFKYENIFREIHIKVFNTGKMEIPGIFNTDLLEIVKTMVLQVIQPYVKETLHFVENDVDENVLINSNFNCGFYVNREKLHVILKKKYGIETSYDPCSYPGVKCKFYFNNEKGFHIEEQAGKIMEEDCTMKMSELGENKKYTEVSFMVFRTGSCLIVGNCSERILVFIFEFVKKILQDEYTNICVSSEKVDTKVKKTKLRKKTVTVTQNYLQTIKL
jgi:hypothetical protein